MCLGLPRPVYASALQLFQGKMHQMLLLQVSCPKIFVIQAFFLCSIFFSPNKFVFHSHRLAEGGKYIQPDAANFNSWRRHIRLLGDPPDEVVHAWEDVKVR